MPLASFEVEKFATPPASPVVPRTVAPSLKVTLPVGVPEDADTVAVNFTAFPEPTGFGDAVIEVLVVLVIPKLSVLLLSALPATSTA